MQRYLIMKIPKPLYYVCPIKSGYETPQTATCQNCMYYPLDKAHSLPSRYTPTVVPTGLAGGGLISPTVKPALAALFAEARQQGYSPVVTSAYRSYSQQAKTFMTWVSAELDQTHNLIQAISNAIQYSAWAGHSEHQLGTTLDVNCQRCVPFDQQDQRNVALWGFLERNGHRFGFVISYPRIGATRTGYTYEPWHIRYVGVAYATELFSEGYTAGNGVCLLSLLKTKKRY
jgi:D-alanyl-D-alanine carboxypeptidase